LKLQEETSLVAGVKAWGLLNGELKTLLGIVYNGVERGRYRKSSRMLLKD
jgi:hypothetical protein